MPATGFDQQPPSLRTATHCYRLGAHYDIEGVADSAVLVLAKFTTPLSPSIPKPRVAFGRDPKACAAVEAMLQMVNRFGLCCAGPTAPVFAAVGCGLLLQAICQETRRANAGCIGACGSNLTQACTCAHAHLSSHTLPSVCTCSLCCWLCPKCNQRTNTQVRRQHPQQLVKHAGACAAPRKAGPPATSS